MAALATLPKVPADALGPDRDSIASAQAHEFNPLCAPVHLTRLRDVDARARVAVAGNVVDVTPARWAGGITLEVTIDDGTGLLVLVFFGRHSIGGVEVGSRVAAGGTVLGQHGRLILLNPYLWLSAHQ
jgi:hypothetical protein